MSTNDTPESGSSTDASDDEVNEDGSTSSTKKRHWLTNDGLAILLVATFASAILLDAYGWIALGGVPDRVIVAWLAIVGTAVAWAFGRDAVAAWRGDG